MSSRLRVVELAGDGRPRGEAHGEQLRELVHEAADRFRATVLATAPLAEQDYLEALVDRTGFRAAILRWTPDLADEVAGIAAASGLDERTVLAMSLIDEEWWLRAELSSAANGHHCTSMACRPGDDTTLLAQNLDLPKYLDGLQVLLDIRPSDGSPRALVPSMPGVIGLNGLNEHGLGVCVNTLEQLPKSYDGLPVAAVVRHLLRQADLPAAQAACGQIEHASGQNYLLADPDAALAVECSAAGAVPWPGRGGVVTHTNHPIVAACPRPGSALGVREVPLPHAQNSESRLHAATDALEAAEPSVESIRRLLLTPPVLRGRDGDRGFSWSSIVMECSAQPALSMTAGPPDLAPYQRFSLADSSVR